MRILVKYNNSYCYWVDTVITRDDCPRAILVWSDGVVFPICLDKIEIVDDSYNYEKQKERYINELKNKTSMLKLQTELNAKIQELYGKKN